MAHTLVYRAHDDEIVSFQVPPGCNRWLVQKAVEKIHKHGDDAAVFFGLTRAETELAAEIVATLEEHKAKAEAAS